MARQSAIDRKLAELYADRARLDTQIAVLKELKGTRPMPKPRVVKPKAVS